MLCFPRVKNLLTIFLVLLAVSLIGCEQSSSPGKDKQKAASTEKAEPVPANVPFKVLDIGERSFENAPALAVLFSHPMKSGKRYNEFLHVSNKNGPVKGAWVLADNRRILYFPHVKPQTKYVVTVDAGLASASGAVLGDSRVKRLTTRKITPVVSFLSQGLLLPKDLSDGLPVVSINVPEVDIEFFRIKPNALYRVSRRLAGSNMAGYYTLKQLNKMADLVYSGRFELNPPPNTRTVTHIPVRDMDALKAPGMYFAVMRKPGEYRYQYNTTYFFVSNIGVQARFYRNKVVVLTSSLKTGKSLSDVRISIQNNRGKEIASGRTNEHGELRLDTTLVHRTLLIAEHGKDISFLPLTGPALDLSAFKLGDRPFKSREVFAYSPRDIYRSGEKVIVSAILRDHDGHMVPAVPLQARLIRPDHREALRFVWQPSAKVDVNYYQKTIQLSENAPTGDWQLAIRVDPSSRVPDQVFRFKVEDFVPERMKLTLTAPQEVLHPRDPFVVDVQGDYLYGAPAAGNRLEASLVIRHAGELLKNRKGFLFGDNVKDAHINTIQLDAVELNDKGFLQVNVASQWRNVKTPLQLFYTASLFETGGRPVTRSISRQVWPADALVGVRALTQGKRYFEQGQVDFELIKAKADGKLVEAKGLQVTLIRQDRDYYWEYSENQGWHYAYSQSNYPVAQQDVDLKGDKAGKVSFNLKYGHYLMEVLDPSTGLTTRNEFRVGWWSWQQGSGTTRPDEVTLRLDKNAYDAGDIAKLTIVPPHDGEAVVMVEGGELLWSRHLSVKAKGTTIEIPVSKEWDRHDLYVSTVVFRPGNAKEKITPNRAVGLLPLRLNREPRRLGVSVSAPEVTEPLKPVNVDIKIKDVGKGSVYVTLAAVDAGILSLTDFKTPDPFEALFGQRRYSVDTYDLYNKVVELVDGLKAKIRFGGDADVANAGQRAKSRLEFVTLFSGAVQVDANGHARIALDLPDFNGKVRLMAVAFSGKRFGSSDREMIIRSPLVTQLSMPRFLAGGDQSVFTLDVNNLSGRDEHLELSLSTDGPITLRDGKRSLDIADGEKKTLHFPVSAAMALATANITLKVKGKYTQVQRHWKLDVRPPYPGETRRIYTSIPANGEFTLDKGLYKNLVPATVQSYVNISSTPPLDLAKNLHDLLHYPYGCLEQTTSSSYPWIFITPELVKRFGLNAERAARRDESVEKGIRRIADKQLYTGGFGLWSGHDKEESWLTPYAVNFLLDAREQGFGVPNHMLNRALRRLQQYLQTGVSTSLVDQYRHHRNYARFASTAYAAYLLARVNRAPLGSLRTLYERQRKFADASLPLLHLGLALKMAGDPERADIALREALDRINRKRDRYYYGDYGSNVRDLAMAIHLLYRHKVEVTGRDELVFKLSDALKKRTWLSTQERNALFMAGVSLSQGGRPFSGKLLIGDKVHEVSKLEHLILRPDYAQMQSGVKFVSGTARRLYVKITVGGYPQKLPRPVSKPIRIERSYYTTDGKPLGDRAVKVGELLLVHVRVQADRYIPDALVEDLLPAGLEPESQGLAHSVKLNDLVLNGTPVSKLRANSEIVHEEYRDDRYTAAIRLYGGRSVQQILYLVRAVTPGVYKVPAPQVESMYRPENRGIGFTRETIKVVP